MAQITRSVNSKKGKPPLSYIFVAKKASGGDQLILGVELSEPINGTKTNKSSQKKDVQKL